MRRIVAEPDRGEKLSSDEATRVQFPYGASLRNAGASLELVETRSLLARACSFFGR